MHGSLIPLKIAKLVHTGQYTLIMLRSADGGFSIYADIHAGRCLELYLADLTAPRPLVYDLISSILLALNVSVMQSVINDVKDQVFFARLFLKPSSDSIVEIDARPSDCIILSIIHGTPLYCTKKFLKKRV